MMFSLYEIGDGSVTDYQRCTEFGSHANDRAFQSGAAPYYLTTPSPLQLWSGRSSCESLTTGSFIRSTSEIRMGT